MADGLIPMLGAGVIGWFVGVKLAKRYISKCSPASDSAILAAYYALVSLSWPFVGAGLGVFGTRILAIYGFGYFSLYIGSIGVAYKILEVLST